MAAIIDFLNTIFWGYILIYGLLAVGVYFTLRLGFIQVRRFPEFIRTVLKAPQSDRGGISLSKPFVLVSLLVLEQAT